MVRKKSGAIVCPSCGSLVSVNEDRCPFCGAVAPGLKGYGPALNAIFARFDLVEGIMLACGLLYVASLALDPSAIGMNGLWNLGSPGSAPLWRLGMTGSVAWREGHWWTLLTANYLHGSLIHIAFNLWWIRTLGHAAREYFGPARFFVVYTVAGVCGFLASNLLGNPPTLGASAATFGLMGALLAFGRRRGGAFGQALKTQMLRWAIILFVFGLFMGSTNNVAHAGGFVGGLLTGSLVPVFKNQGESQWVRLLAVVLLLATMGAFALNLVVVQRAGWFG